MRSPVKLNKFAYLIFLSSHCVNYGNKLIKTSNDKINSNLWCRDNIWSRILLLIPEFIEVGFLAIERMLKELSFDIDNEDVIFNDQLFGECPL